MIKYLSRTQKALGSLCGTSKGGRRVFSVANGFGRVHAFLLFLNFYLCVGCPMCTVSMAGVWRTKGVRSPGTGATDGCELTCLILC